MYMTTDSTGVSTRTSQKCQSLRTHTMKSAKWKQQFTWGRGHYDCRWEWKYRWRIWKFCWWEQQYRQRISQYAWWWWNFNQNL